MSLLAIVSADKEIVELAQSLHHEVIGYLDPRDLGLVVGIPYLGSEKNKLKLLKSHPQLKFSIALDVTKLRKKLFEFYKESHLETLISKDAFVSKSARVGAGSIVQMGCRVLADSQVGRGCKLNVGATVHHDSRVGDFCTLAPRSLILGNVRLADRVYVGAGAIVLPRVKVESDVTIGAGAVVTKDLPRGVVVAGVPARELKK